MYTYYIKEGKFEVYDHSKIPYDKLHRIDGPALVGPSGTEEWYINGKRHRENGPAITWANGSEEWRVNGKLHREDGPAYISVDFKSWWKNGKRHREDGPACTDNRIGFIGRYINGVKHRIGGPAIKYLNGTKEWCINGKLHRLDGPAVIKKYGHKEYWINGKKLNKKEVETWIKNNNINLRTKQHQTLFMVKFR